MIIDWRHTLEVLQEIAPVAEAAFVGIGLVIVVWQLMEIRAELKQKKFQALQWAMSLVSSDKMLRYEHLFYDDGKHGTEDYFAFWNLIHDIVQGLEVVVIAIDEGYVDRKLFIKARYQALSLFDPSHIIYRESQFGPTVRVHIEELLWFDPRFRSLVREATAYHSQHFRPDEGIRHSSDTMS